MPAIRSASTASRWRGCSTTFGASLRPASTSSSAPGRTRNGRSRCCPGGVASPRPRSPGRSSLPGRRPSTPSSSAASKTCSAAEEAAVAEIDLHGYSDEIAVAPGERIRFMVSCTGAESYRADIVRLIHGDTNPAGPGFKEELVQTAVGGEYPAREQVLHAGSHVLVADPAGQLDLRQGF